MDLLRRLVLTLLVIIVVARPLVGGEFPGQMSDLADPGSMALTFLTLLALAGWAGWRALRREPAVYLGWADLAVLTVAGLGFLGAAGAGYLRPAWLAGWDWLSLGAAFFLVRQLAVHAEEKHGLMAVLLAVAVALSAEGVYQAVRVLPAETRAEEKYREDKLDDDPYGYHRTELMVRGLTPSPLELYELRDRLARSRVHGPYFRADSLAAVLALALPLVAGVVLASLRGQAALWQRLLAGVCLVGVAAVLVLARSWPAVLAAGAGALAGLGFLILPRRGAVGLTGVLLVAWAGLVWQLGLAAPTVEVGPGALQVLAEHPWRGVGPAQFGYHYPRHMAATAGPRVLTPGNAVLDVWASGGLAAALALVAAVVLVTLRLARWRPTPTDETGAPPPPTTDQTPLHWEYYVGGMLGLVLAFVLRVATVMPEDILAEATVAGLRAVVWFAAFGLFETVGWALEEFTGALAAGCAAMFLALLTVPGIEYPSVALLLLTALALLLATIDPLPNRWLSRQSAVGLLAVPLFLGTSFGYFAFFFFPAAASASALHRSRLAGLYFLAEMKKAPTERAFDDPARFIRTNILEPVEQVQREDPENIRLMTQLATWYGQLWALDPGEETLWKKALSWSAISRRVAPLAPEGYFTEFNLRRRIVAVLNLGIKNLENEKPDPRKTPTPPEERKKLAARLREDVRTQHRLAIAVLEEFRPRDPTDPQVPYLLAAEHLELGQGAEGRRLAEEAQRLNAEVRPPRTLPGPQRDQLEKWLTQDPKK